MAGIKGYVGSARRNPRSLGAIRVKGHEGWRGHVTDFDESKTSDSFKAAIALDVTLINAKGFC